MAEEAKLEESAVPEETDFEAAFTEHAAKKEDPPEVVDEVVEAEGTTEEPKAVEEPPETEETKDAAEETPEPAKEPDPYEGMTEEAIERFKALEETNKTLSHRLDSDAGRVSAFQRKINAMESEIQSIRQGSTTGEQPSNTQIAEAMRGTDDEWDKFTEDYPEVAQAIDSRLAKAGQATQDTIEKTLAPVVEQQGRIAQNEATTAVQESIAAVAKVYPTWTEAVKTTEFQTWLDTQSPGINALAESDDTDDASTLIGLYDNHLVASGQPTLKADPGPGVKENEEAVADGSEPTELEKKRTQQLEDGTTVASKSAQINPGQPSPDEFEAAFEYHARRKEAQRA